TTTRRRNALPDAGIGSRRRSRDVFGLKKREQIVELLRGAVPRKHHSQLQDIANVVVLTTSAQRPGPHTRAAIDMSKQLLNAAESELKRATKNLKTAQGRRAAEKVVDAARQRQRRARIVTEQAREDWTPSRAPSSGPFWTPRGGSSLTSGPCFS